MKRTTIEKVAAGGRVPGGLARRLSWFAGLWLASVTGLGAVAYVLHKIIIG